MESKKKVLYFFPLNPVDGNAGSVTRALSLLHYFRHKGFLVDFMNSNDEWGKKMSEEDIRIMKEDGLAQHFYSLSKKTSVKYSFSYLRYAISNIFLRKLLKIGTNTLTNYDTTHRRTLLNKVLKQNDYDYIIISYAYWARLVEKNPNVGKAKLIIDTHDFLTSQDQNKTRFNIGKGFAEEIKRLNIFDEIWTISSDEQYLFSQFCTKEVKLVPVSFASKPCNCSEKHNVIYDLIYVAGDNSHNIKSSIWFFKKVYPLLPKEIRICVIGKINHFVDDLPNVTKVFYAKDLEKYYRSAKVSICPILSGTGIKIKVIEALSFGLPVVCTPRGVDGLINKTHNGCLVANDERMFCEHIMTLLEDAGKYNYYKQKANDFFLENHSLDSCYAIMDKSFDNLNRK